MLIGLRRSVRAYSKVVGSSALSMSTTTILAATLLFVALVSVGASAKEANKKYAYVSVLYNEEFMMGIRTLGSSLKRR